MSIKLGELSELVQARYVVHLSDGKRLVLFRLPSIDPSRQKPHESLDGWSYYAMEAECPHAGGPMAESSVDIEDSAYVVSCPWHAYDFNVETGESSVGIKTCTYPIYIRDQIVFLNYPQGGREVRLARLEAVSEKVKLKHDQNSDVLTTQPLNEQSSFCDWAVEILGTADPERKIELTHRLYTVFNEKEVSSSPMALGKGRVKPPDQPPRDGLVEVNPWEIQNPGRGGTVRSRIAMLHALANIELWAIDLAIDICVRFATFQTERNVHELPRTFFRDWLKVANDEAKHFSLLRTRIEELGYYFGALSVHHGLWESATRTAHDLRARISIIALVHEARGLDINPMTIEKFRKAGDTESVAALEIIHHDEITHVTTGHRWLTWICDQEGTDPIQVFRSNVQKYFRGGIRGPFNEEARLQAGMDQRWYKIDNAVTA
ncbi:Rieske [2Fe-2S] domain protein [Talaromyces stipitatus ATCC 10500]|uniref:Rieske [2Fe-2S] domain protein n=1 Tax=Talaromyces stipitatus (strain ATCC 10500 / CBS 375.48 / QM 6759 / NRRL 1006) TaxID=441959 RepID=B8LZX1_TALSN|nr:Rieske [2Fe-2S] domain protein [Talaromyces stipitatus ATCC 10500]EED20903.1 Rieske [2Fe-2S] domain protein [Talaromyces stipitatus ATCC 10500]